MAPRVSHFILGLTAKMRSKKSRKAILILKAMGIYINSTTMYQSASHGMNSKNGDTWNKYFQTCYKPARGYVPNVTSDAVCTG